MVNEQQCCSQTTLRSLHTWSASQLHRINCPPADTRVPICEMLSAGSCAGVLATWALRCSPKHEILHVVEMQPQQDNLPTVKSGLLLTSLQACRREENHQGGERDEI